MFYSMRIKDVRCFRLQNNISERIEMLGMRRVYKWIMVSFLLSDSERKRLKSEKIKVVVA